jgi:hypothetical protein
VEQKNNAAVAIFIFSGRPSEGLTVRFTLVRQLSETAGDDSKGAL